MKRGEVTAVGVYGDGDIGCVRGIVGNGDKEAVTAFGHGTPRIGKCGVGEWCAECHPADCSGWKLGGWGVVADDQ